MSEAPARAAEATATAVSATGALEVFGSLLLVLGAIFALAWLARWMQGARVGRGAMIRVHGGAQLGAKEKVVLLQVGDQQLLVGVAAGGVTLLHRFDTPVTSSDDAEPQLVSGSFAERLRQAIGMRSES